MGTFGGFTRIRSGYWVGIRTWLLKETMDIPKRIDYIEKERERIGRITVDYEVKDDGRGNFIATENRLAFTVTPNSSLEKLVKSYILMGGNPMDISMFMYPDTTKVYASGADDLGTDHLINQKYPYDGKVSPIQRKDSESSQYKRSDVDTVGNDYSYGSDPGGGLNVKKYQPPRIDQGARLIWTQEHTIQSAVMHDLRNWANQEIAEKLHLLEHKIIKLCDLEEQLTEEIEVLTKAFGETIEELFPYYGHSAEEMEKDLTGLKLVDGSRRFHRDNLVQFIIYDFDQVFFFPSEEPYGIEMLENIQSMLKVKWAYPDFESESVLDFCL